MKPLLFTALAAALVSTAGIFAVSLLISSFYPDFTNLNNEAIIQMISEAPWSMALQTIILAPIAEECLFRGLLFVPIHPKNPACGYFISAAAFAAVHILSFVGMAPTQTLVLGFLQYLPSALALSWACAKTDCIFGSITAHSILNAFSFINILIVA